MATFAGGYCSLLDGSDQVSEDMLQAHTDVDKILIIDSCFFFVQTQSINSYSTNTTVQ